MSLMLRLEILAGKEIPRVLQGRYVLRTLPRRAQKLQSPASAGSPVRMPRAAEKLETGYPEGRPCPVQNTRTEEIFHMSRISVNAEFWCTPLRELHVRPPRTRRFRF